MTALCANCSKEFEIISPSRETIDGINYIRCGTGLNVVYESENDNEYAFCPHCSDVQEVIK